MTYTIEDANGNIVTVVILAGSFVLHGDPVKQKYKYHSPHDTVPNIKAQFKFNKCRFKLVAKGVDGAADLVGTSMTVSLQVGTSGGRELIVMEDDVPERRMFRLGVVGGFGIEDGRKRSGLGRLGHDGLSPTGN